jgi:hypothetical protein
MSRNGTGSYSLPAGNPVTTGTTISSTWANNTLSDIASALTGSVAKDGQTTMTGALPMGGNKITGLANGVASGDAATIGQTASSASLAASSGASLVGWIESGTGAVLRTVQDKLRESVSVKDFGAKGDGSTNDNTAIGLAITALNAGTFKCLYFPAGSYIVSATFTITVNGAVLVGDGARTSIILQTLNVDTFIFTSTNPTSVDPNIGRIADIGMRDIGVDYGGITAPTAGKAVTLIRPSRSRFSNVHISSVFNGIDISGGGGDNFFSNLTVSGSYSWTVVANNSWLLRFTKYANGINEVPSEYFFENFNIKGSVTPNYLQNAIIIQCGDGIWFSNGHCGFTDQNDLWINAQNDASAPISDIKFDHVYFDGNFGGSTSGAGIAINGSDTAYMEQITFIGCVSKIHNGHGVNNARGVVGLVFEGCQITYNGAYGVILNGTAATYNDGLIFRGNYINQNNANNSGSDAFTCSYTTSAQVSGNNVKGVLAKPHPNGFNIGAATSNMVVTDNITKNCTVDYTPLVTSMGMTVARNRKADTEPTIVSADGMVVPFGFDVVIVTGNTNFSNIGGTLVAGRVITLRFTGTPTCFDSAGNIKLAGNFVSTVDSTLTLMCTGTTWTEVSRAIV